MNSKNKFILQYYLLFFFKGFLLLKQYLILLMGTTLTPIQITSIVSIFSIVEILAEIPTGALSDYFGCKKVLIFGIIIYILAYVMILFNKNICTFYIFYACYGLYNTLLSGTKDSLVYNNIQYYNMLDEFPMYKSRSKILSLISLTIVANIASRLINISYNLLIISDIFILILFAFLINRIDDKSKNYMEYKDKNYLLSIINGIKFIFSNELLLKFVFFEGIWCSVWTIIINYLSLIYKEMNVNYMSIGMLISTQTFCGVIIQNFLIRFLINRNILKNARLFILAGILSVISFVIYNGAVAYIFNTLYIVIIQIGDVLFYPKIQSLIQNEHRAIVVSTTNAIMCVMKVIILHFLGFILKFYSYRIGFLLISMLYLIFSVLFYFSIYFDKNIKKLE